MDGLTTGEVAKEANVNLETLRYYERRGLSSQSRPEASPQTTGVIRETVTRVRFIKGAQDFGFSLTEIKELLSLRATNGARCADVRKRAEAKIDDIEQRIRSLGRRTVERQGESPLSRSRRKHHVGRI